MKPTARAGGVDPARRATGRWLAALVLGATLSLPWTVQRHWDAKPDAATYLIAARSLARGEGVEDREGVEEGEGVTQGVGVCDGVTLALRGT